MCWCQRKGFPGYPYSVARVRALFVRQRATNTVNTLMANVNRATQSYIQMADLPGPPKEHKIMD